MKKFILAIILLFVFVTPAYAQEKEVRVLGPEEVTTSDHFTAGDEVQILGTVGGDLYTAGGTLLLEGTVLGDVLAAGGELTINGFIHEDVRVAGGNVLINGEIQGNVTVAGGTVEISPEAKIAGNVVAAGGELIIAGQIEGNVKAAGGTITISGMIFGKSDLWSDSIKITPSAQITGDLNYWSKNDIDQAAGATVAGTINKTVPVYEQWDWKDSAKSARFGANIFSLLVSLFSTAVFGFILLTYFPRYTERATQGILKNPGKSFLGGLLALIAIPFICVLLFITILGIPLAFSFVAVSFIYLYVVRVIGMMAIGMFLTKKAKMKTSTRYIFVIGVLSYYAISIIPFIGGLLKFVIILTAFGGALINEKKTYKLSKKLGAY